MMLSFIVGAMLPLVFRTVQLLCCNSCAREVQVTDGSDPPARCYRCGEEFKHGWDALRPAADGSNEVGSQPR